MIVFAWLCSRQLSFNHQSNDCQCIQLNISIYNEKLIKYPQRIYAIVENQKVNQAYFESVECRSPAIIMLFHHTGAGRTISTIGSIHVCLPLVNISLESSLLENICQGRACSPMFSKHSGKYHGRWTNGLHALSNPSLRHDERPLNHKATQAIEKLKRIALNMF